MTTVQALAAYCRSNEWTAGLSADRNRVEAVLAASRPQLQHFPVLLSEAAGEMLETMAQRARELTMRRFGAVVQLFTPLYVSNYCENTCRYCSFSSRYHIDRRHLEPGEIRAECERIAASGIRYVLLLTGEARAKAPPEYVARAVGIACEYFAAVGVEVYPLTEAEYAAVIAAGADALTIYQEVYDEAVYLRLHEGGPKRDYAFRLEAAERACRAGIRAVTIGPLLGLAEPRREACCAAAHLDFLQRTFPGTELSISLPRIRPLVADFPVEHPVSDRLFVQMLCALRIVFPTVGITISTREKASLRNAIVPLGVTRLSAGVSTAVGGRSDGRVSTSQFEIADTRSVAEVVADLQVMGYQPVMHDWNHDLLRCEKTPARGT